MQGQSKQALLKAKPLALIVDDEEAIGSALLGVFSDEGWQAVVATSGQEGLKLFARARPDFVLLDVWMPGMDGIETLQAMKETNPKVPIVIMSGHGTIETAVRATKLGAFDFLEKPLSLDKLLPMIEHALVLRSQEQSTVGQDASRTRVNLIGESPAMLSIKRQIKMVAPRNAWVLITGENGTGKEVVASQIHQESSRARQPFVALNCAAIPEDLIESELFGHEKGAYTGATSMQRGKFEQAHQGTLFLDEIGDMSLRTQAKVLRVLQEQQFERVGGDETISVDVRVIAATNKDLEVQIKQGLFREDLFYRLNVVPFVLPPLRERGVDLLSLAEHFLDQVAKELGEPVKTLSIDAKRALEAYRFPGNVRELRNLIERLCLLVPGALIDVKDLPEHIVSDKKISLAMAGSQGAGPSSLKDAKSEFERVFILEKLQENNWNVSRTADAIGIERSNLHRKIRTFNIDTKKLKDE